MKIIVIFRCADLSSNQPCCNEAAQEVKTWHQTEASHGPRKLEKNTERKTQIESYSSSMPIKMIVGQMVWVSFWFKASAM